MCLSSLIIRKYKLKWQWDTTTHSSDWKSSSDNINCSPVERREQTSDARWERTLICSSTSGNCLALCNKVTLEKEMATHSSTLAWRIPWTEEAGRLQSMGSQRVRQDWATSLSFFAPTVALHAQSKASSIVKAIWTLTHSFPGQPLAFVPIHEHHPFSAQNTTYRESRPL